MATNKEFLHHVRFPKIFVAGATGLLGGRIVRALLGQGGPVRALVRPGGSAEKKSSLTGLRAAGLEVVEGDLTDPAERLAEAVGDATIVISAVQGGPDVIGDGQVNLVRAAEKAGARRFIPSDFAVDPAATGTPRFTGEVMSMPQFHDAVQRGSGRTLELRHLGTADDLRAEISRQAAVAQNPFDYVALQYQWCMVSGKAKFDRLDNDRYPQITPQPPAGFVRATAPAL
ncbi:NmrA family NAD(P)-binding protein [Nonomuraea composti]|uniref:NmrA family NAD(P)-binding protein n=1 Tax=Nonomuraea composti TaxID=2720023 RepID=UPI001F0D7319|nr:NmrA family NAD(P)-binding protein [Nonomuraea sp. FMUSA5-5]